MMSGHGTLPGARGSHAEPIAARVLLVGKTGLDSKLRLDANLELIRTRTAIDALGELANPVGGRARRTVVIVGRDTDIGGRSGSAREFVAGVRRVLPSASVMVVAGANSPESDAYDSVVEPNLSSYQLRSIIHTEDASVPEPEPGTPIFASASKPGRVEADDLSDEELAMLAEEPTPLVEDEDDENRAAASATVLSPAPPPIRDEPRSAPKPPEAQDVAEAPAAPHVTDRPVAEVRAPESPRSVPTPPPAVTSKPPAPRTDDREPPGMAPYEGVSREGDGLLVSAMLGGRSVLEPAMGVLRSRVSRPDLEFVEITVPDQKPPAGGVAVEFGGRIFGWLVAGRDPEALTLGDEPVPGGMSFAEHARWLAGWLMLSDQHRRLRAEAMTDRVSGAWNRRYFDRFLAAAIEQARSRRQMLTILVFDLDNFKSFNDDFGHEAGDMILRETVNLMHSLTRPTDRICRIGGDEFAVIFYEPEGPRDQNSRHPTQFADVADRFQRAIVEQRFPRLGIDAPGRLTISGGLATFPWDGSTPEDLLRKADQLAIESKRSGKNGITLGGHGG